MADDHQDDGEELRVVEVGISIGAAVTRRPAAGVVGTGRIGAAAAVGTDVAAASMAGIGVVRARTDGIGAAIRVGAYATGPDGVGADGVIGDRVGADEVGTETQSGGTPVGDNGLPGSVNRTFLNESARGPEHPCPVPPVLRTRRPPAGSAGTAGIRRSRPVPGYENRASAPE
ncbi:hypothetical protein GCM10023195_08530 [Actinoallomurus liliacearum]|uniref:Uncharacterized protein n=1 Tax=Actinoallomurus liliacearum TaxID=1080073 RepID=A0ABP8TE12_9ACTN